VGFLSASCCSKVSMRSRCALSKSPCVVFNKRRLAMWARSFRATRVRSQCSFHISLVLPNRITMGAQLKGCNLRGKKLKAHRGPNNPRPFTSCHSLYFYFSSLCRSWCLFRLSSSASNSPAVPTLHHARPCTGTCTCTHHACTAQSSPVMKKVRQPDIWDRGPR